MNRRRVVGSVAAVLLAVFGAVVLAAYVQSAHHRASAAVPTANVLVITKAVQQGTLASSLGGSVKVERVPINTLAQGSVTSLAPLGTRVAAVALVPGEQVASSLFVSAAAFGSFPAPPGMLQVTLSLAPERALGANLVPGQTVGVLASFTSGAASGSLATTHLILQKVLVTSVEAASTSNGVTSATSKSSVLGPKTVSTGNVYVTLALGAPSVERVVFAAEHGTVWLAAEPASAPEGGTQVQTLKTVNG